MVGNRAKIMWVMTFHAACVRILRENAKRLGYTTTFSIYDSADSQRLMTLVCRELDLDPKRYPPRAFTAQISNLKNELVDPEDFERRANNHHEKTLAEAYTSYQRRLREANAFDFDDLIMVTVNLFRPSPTSPSTIAVASVTYSSTSTRTPTTPSTCWCASWSAAPPISGRNARSTANWSGPAPTSHPASSWSSATPISRSTRFGAPRSATSWSSSATTPMPASSCSSRTTGHADDPQCRQRGHHPTRAARRRTCGQRPARANRSAATSPTTSGARRVRCGGDRPAARPRRSELQRRRDLLPNQRPVADLRGDLHQGGPALQGRGRRPGSTSAARCATCWRICGSGQPEDPVSLRRNLERPRRRHRRARREACVEAIVEHASDLVLAGVSPEVATRLGIATVGSRYQGFLALLADSRRDRRVGRRRPR